MQHHNTDDHGVRMGYGNSNNSITNRNDNLTQNNDSNDNNNNLNYLHNNNNNINNVNNINNNHSNFSNINVNIQNIHSEINRNDTMRSYRDDQDEFKQPILTNGTLFGHNLNDFQLLKTLGTGTFGRVYLSKYRDTNQYYAVKVLPKTEIVRLKQVEHINSEKNILAIIDFPFIVNMICTFQDTQNIYMLLEYVIGGELFSHLRRSGRFSNDITRFYTAEIVLAIEYLHSLNIIYRDLKPENLLLDERGHIKITDFGFAKRVTDRTWTLCGTPEYLAPEIIQSKGHGKAVDWWALGILVFEMLAGYPPFFDENPFGIYEKILANKAVYPTYFHPDAKDLIKRLLNTDRSRRLGNLSGGAIDVKNHKWFNGVDWNLLLAKGVRAPYIPESRYAGDTRNFENYPEIQQQQQNSEDSYRSLFKTF